MIDSCIHKTFPSISHEISSSGIGSPPLLRIDAIWTLTTKTTEFFREKNHSFAARSSIPCMMELFLCEMMHQLSMCIGNDNDRKQFVDEFRDTRFNKIHIIATRVMGPLIRQNKMSMLHYERNAMNDVVKVFGKYGYVPADVRPPLILEIAVDVGCLEIFERKSTDEEILDCLVYLAKKCVEIKSSTKPSCVWVKHGIEDDDKIDGLMRKKHKHVPLVDVSSSNIWERRLSTPKPAPININVEVVIEV